MCLTQRRARREGNAECPIWVISGHAGLHEKASALPLKLREKPGAYLSLHHFLCRVQTRVNG